MNPTGFSTSAYIEYGPTSSYGSFADVSLSPNDGTTPQEVTATITGLIPDSEYHCRLVAVNENATACTADTVFTPTTLTPVQTWRFAHFGTLAGTGTAADDADPDGDGQINRLEYLAGTDPTLRASVLVFEMNSPGISPRSLCVRPVRPGVRYVVQVSDDGLANWNNWPALLYDAPSDGIVLNDPDEPTGFPRFYRLRLEEVP